MTFFEIAVPLLALAFAAASILAARASARALEREDRQTPAE